MRRVIVESPYSGDVPRNLAYARRCLLHGLRRNEAPLASHLLYTQVLDDMQSHERELGMHAGFAWTQFADAVVVYTDCGISRGMNEGISIAKSFNIPVEYRSLEKK